VGDRAAGACNPPPLNSCDKDQTFKPIAVEKLEDPERRVWLQPGDVIALLDLHAGMWVADIGAPCEAGPFPQKESEINRELWLTIRS